MDARGWLARVPQGGLFWVFFVFRASYKAKNTFKSRLQLFAILETGLPAGTYTVDVENKYSVTIFGNGTKSVLVSNTSFIGGYNPFLGYAYIAVGSLCLALSLMFFIVNLVKPRQLGDPSLLSWNRDVATHIN